MLWGGFHRSCGAAGTGDPGQLRTMHPRGVRQASLMRCRHCHGQVRGDVIVVVMFRFDTPYVSAVVWQRPVIDDVRHTLSRIRALVSLSAEGRRPFSLFPFFTNS